MPEKIFEIQDVLVAEKNGKLLIGHKFVRPGEKGYFDAFEETLQELQFVLVEVQ